LDDANKSKGDQVPQKTVYKPIGSSAPLI